jgi:hypothetical protein
LRLGVVRVTVGEPMCKVVKWLALALAVAAIGSPLLLTPGQAQTSTPRAAANQTAGEANLLYAGHKPYANPNSSPRFIQVYNDNVENLPTTSRKKCPGDWKDLISYMKTREYVPDVFLVQQVRHRNSWTS